MSYEAYVAALSNGDKISTATRLINNPSLADLVHASMGLSGEAGEALDIIKKTIYYGRELDRDHLLEELGDIMHYLTAAAVSQGWTLLDLQTANKTKLDKRFPNGKFSSAAANARADKNGK